MVSYDNKSWLSVAFRVKGSVLPRIAVRLVITAVIGVAAAAFYQRTQMKFPSIIHTLLGVAIGLLLVFRTNASYDRWWEGRRLLGAMTNRTRDLSRQITASVRDEAERATLRRLIVAFYRLACQGLRKERDLARLGALLTAEEHAKLEPCEHRANVVYTWITLRLTALADAGQLTEQRLQSMDQNLQGYADYIGGSERIMKTPIPFAYAQHTKMLVVLFVWTAPFVMADTMGWLTPVAASIVGFGMFGIDEIGVEVEDPFGYDDNDLPVDAIGDTIDANTREIVTKALS